MSFLLCLIHQWQARKQMMIIFSHLLTSCWNFPQMWQLYDSSTGKGVFVQTPIKCVLFCPRYVIQEKMKRKFLQEYIVSFVLRPSVRVHDSSDERSKHHKTRNSRHRNLDGKNTVLLVIPWKLRMVRSLLDYIVQNIARNSDKPKTTGCKVRFYIFLGTVIK